MQQAMDKQIHEFETLDLEQILKEKDLLEGDNKDYNEHITTFYDNIQKCNILKQAYKLKHEEVEYLYNLYKDIIDAISSKISLDNTLIIKLSKILEDEVDPNSMDFKEAKKFQNELSKNLKELSNKIKSLGDIDIDDIGDYLDDLENSNKQSGIQFIKDLLHYCNINKTTNITKQDFIDVSHKLAELLNKDTFDNIFENVEDEYRNNVYHKMTAIGDVKQLIDSLFINNDSLDINELIDKF